MKYCMNLETGSVREGVNPRISTNLERLSDPGFRPVAVPTDLPRVNAILERLLDPRASPEFRPVAVPTYLPRVNANLEMLIDPRTGGGFRPVPVPADLPLELQPGRTILRNRKRDKGI